MRASFTTVISAVFLLCLISEQAAADVEMTAEEVITKLGLVESERPVRDMPGWAQSNTIVVLVDGPERLAWYKEVVPDSVTLIPAMGYRAAIEAASANRDALTAAVGFCSEPLVRAAPNLHWLHMPFAGVARCVSIPEIAQGDHIVTNMQRLAGPHIAEHVMAMMLYFARGLDHYAAEQAKGSWNREATRAGDLWSINGKTMLVAGLGGIGTQTARLASGFGMRVIATRNSSREGPDFVDYVGLSYELPDLMQQADVVVNALPLTDSTRGLFDAEMFSLMKPTALFINVGRGGSVVQPDLIAALESGAIAGAGLDVQDPEPVPAGHPLWDAANLLITPHISGFNDSGRDVFWIILRENLRRYVSGERMLSVVDKTAGY